MTLLDRKVLSELLGALAAALSVLILLLFSRRLYDAVTLALALGMSPGETWHLVLWSFPPVLAYALPMAWLVATLLVFGRFEGDREVLAWAGGGIPRSRLLRAPLFLSLLLAAGSFYIAAEWVPASRMALDRFRIEGPSDPVSSLRPGEVRRIGKTAFRVRGIDPSARDLEGVLVSSIEPRGRTWIAARSATWRVTDTTWVFTFRDGEILTAGLDPAGAAPAAPRSLLFQRYEYALERPRYESPSAANRRTVRSLLVSSDPGDLADAARRISLALAIPFFLIWGVLLSGGGRDVRAARSVALGRAVVFFAFFWILLTGLTALAEKDRIPALVLPLLLAGGLGLGAWRLRRSEELS